MCGSTHTIQWYAGLLLVASIVGVLPENGIAGSAFPSTATSEKARTGGTGFVFASAVGASLDTDLLKGGGTDDTAVLQAVLDRAAGGKPVHLVIDGAALVSGLNVYGNTSIECLAGAGVYLKDGSTRAIIRNVHRSRAAVTDEHITVRGCFLNGNRDHQGGPNSANADHEGDGTYISGLQFFGVNDLTVEDMTLWNVRAFGVWIANGQHIHVSHVRVDNASPLGREKLPVLEWSHAVDRYLDTVGLQFNGPIRYVTIDNLELRTGDDALALNANDGGSDDITVNNYMGPYVGQGPITDVTASNIILIDALFGVRLLSSNQRIDRIVISDVTGTVQMRMAILGHFINHTHTGDIGSVMFNNVNVGLVSVPPTEAWYKAMAVSEAEQKQFERDFPDEFEYPMFSLNSPIESLNLQNVMTRAVDKRPLIWLGADAVVQRMSTSLSVIDPSWQAVPVRLKSGSHVERLSLELDWLGGSVDCGKNPLFNEGGSIGQLHWVDTPPSYVKAEWEKANPQVIIVTLSEAVKGEDFRSGVTIAVNGKRADVSRATRQPSGDVVRYRIGTTIRRSDSVSWSYDAALGTIQNLDGDHMLSVETKKVAMN